MKNLFYRLIVFLDTASESDTNYNIAWYMAHNFRKVSSMGISHLAKECFVSPATISRFCRTLGYENFAHLKQECYDFTSGTKTFNNLVRVPLDKMKENPVLATKEYANVISENILELHKFLDWKIIDKVLELIHRSDDVVFFGTQFSHSAALHLQTDLLMLEKFTVAHMDTNRQVECAKSLTKDSVAILFSVNGYYAHNGYKGLQYMKKSNAKIILVTSNENNEIGIPVDHTIYIGNDKIRKTGKHAMLTAVELMALRYYALYFPEVSQYLEKDYIT